MKSARNMKNRIQNMIVSGITFVTQLLEKELTLSSVKIPELQAIKSAHQKLLAEYVHVLTAASKLPFFMSPIQRVHLETKFGLFLRLVMLALSSANPIRLIILRPIVILAIEMHTKKKLGELEIAYTQLKFLIPSDYPEAEKYLEWLEKARQDCSTLKSTVSSGKIILDAIQFLAVPVITLFAAIYGASSIYDFLAKLVTSSTSSSPFFLVGLALILGIIYIYASVFVKNTFVAKRSILLSTGYPAGASSVYSLENELFKVIGKKKITEFSVDLFISMLNHVAMILFTVFASLEIDKANASSNSSGTYINCFWGFSAIIVINMLSISILPWLSRLRSDEV